MAFDPGLKIGQILKNSDVVDAFKCGNMGGMRRSRTTNTLVIVSDYTKGIYHDKWIGGVLHYTGMGKNGDQDINWAQNATLAACGRNGVDVHLFEVMDAGEYIYCGRIELVDKPYTEEQQFIDVYETVGNVIPVWPGANVHRGQFCCYDCPDIYFNNEKIRDHALAFYNKYSNSYMCGDDAIIAGIYNNMSVKNLINMDKDEYENYIEHAINVIKWRTEKIE